MEIKIFSAKELKDRICFLELRKSQQEQALHDQLENTFESFKSINLLKSAFHTVFTGPDQNSVFPSIAGTVGGLVLSKIIPGGPRNIFKRVLSGAAGWAIGSLVRNKSNK